MAWRRQMWMIFYFISKYPWRTNNMLVYCEWENKTITINDDYIFGKSQNQQIANVQCVHTVLLHAHTLTFGQHLPERQSGEYISFVHLFIDGLDDENGWQFSILFNSSKYFAIYFTYFKWMNTCVYESLSSVFIASAGRFVMVLATRREEIHSAVRCRKCWTSLRIVQIKWLNLTQSVHLMQTKH